MSNFTKEATYAILADSVYWDVRKGGVTPDKQTKSNRTPIPSDWKLIKEMSGSGDDGRVNNPQYEGFTARAYQNGDKIVIAYAGTHQPDYTGDWKNNAQMAAGIASEQAKLAAIFYQQIQQDNIGADIEFTGHSLGGGLAGMMGIWFNRPAYVFDHAPFVNAVTKEGDTKPSYREDPNFGDWIWDSLPESVRSILSDEPEQLITSSTMKYTRQALMDEFGYIDNEFARYAYTDHLKQRVENITAIATKDEFLDAASFMGMHYKENKRIINGETSYDDWLKIGAFAKHSQTLLVNALLDDNFEHYTSVKDDNGANRNTLEMILDADLYGYDQGSTNQNFLTKLLRSHIGATTGGIDYATGEVNQDGTPIKYQSSLLTTFGNSLKIIATALRPYTDNYARLGHDTLIAHAIEWHYHQDIDKYDGSAFIMNNGNVLQFTTAYAEGLIQQSDSKVTSYVQKWIDEAYVQADKAVLGINGMNYDQWNVALAGSYAQARDIDKSQILLTLGGAVRFVAGDKNDALFGSVGDDTLDGRAGNDILVGGAGLDTYHIHDHDTIYDADGQGKIIFADVGTLPNEFSRLDDGIWVAYDDKDNITHTATQQGAHLLISAAGTQHTATIKDFFNIASGGIDNSHTALSITLKDAKSKEPAKQGDVLHLDANTNPNVSAVVYVGNPNGHLHITGSDGGRGDIYFGTGASHKLTIHANNGNDLIYGGMMGDELYGGEGHDIIYGSSPAYDMNPANAPMEDLDMIIGGGGSDLIHGVSGRDTIHADEIGSHLTTASSIEKGNWVLGGNSNDIIYGGEARDLLQGGADSDTIYGGAGDDVILGDGHVQFAHRSQTIQGSSASTHFEYDVIGGGHHLAPGVVTPRPVTTAGSHLTTQYEYKDGDYKQTKLPSTTIRDRRTFEWGFEIDKQTGDYQIHPHKDIGFAVEEYARHSDNATDFLFGGAGDDLIIGQYGDDYLHGGEGHDILWGDDSKNDSIQGNDHLYGGEGNDWLIGGRGDDFLYSGSGQDKLDGGIGFDTYAFALSDLISPTYLKTIIDEDKRGRMTMEGIDWSSKVWLQDTEQTHIYHDGQGNTLTQRDDDYIITSAIFAGSIKLQGMLDTDGKLLGMTLRQTNKTEPVLPEEPKGPTSPITPALPTHTNQAPKVANQQENKTILASQTFSITLDQDLFSDPDGDVLDYAVIPTSTVEGFSFDKNTLSLTGTAPASGKLTFEIIATDPNGQSATQQFTLTVNEAPIITKKAPDNIHLAYDEDKDIIVSQQLFSDNDGDKLSYTISAPNGISMSDNGVIHANAATLGTGTHTVTITATDTYGQSISTDTRIVVQAKPQDPTPPADISHSIHHDPTIKGKAIHGGFGNDTLTGDDFANVMYGSFGHDILIGGKGNDRLEGGFGRDTLIGGQDNDHLIGGFGDDTYIYTKGDGKDRISDIGGQDTLKLQGLTLTDLGFTRTQDDLNILIKGTDEGISIDNYFNAGKTGSSLLDGLISSSQTLQGIANNIGQMVGANAIEHIHMDNQVLYYQDVVKLVENHQGII